jgi:hypothetical protein
MEDNLTIPLYESFIQLMQLESGELHRGIDAPSYLLLLETLNNGYFLNTKEELVLLCKKLWLKPFHTNEHPVNEQVLETIVLRNISTARINETPSASQQAGKADTPIRSEHNTSTEDPGTDLPSDLPAAPPPVEYRPQYRAKLSISIEEGSSDSKVTQGDYTHYFKERNFTFNNRYQPLSGRSMEQTIRSLRYRVKGTGRKVLDIEATVADSSKKGFFDQLSFREEDDFITRWTLAFDRGGSMLPFHGFQDHLLQVIKKGTIENKGDLFYFRNTISESVFLNEERTSSIPVGSLAASQQKNILIVSDAGAARGNWIQQRVVETCRMLHTLRRHRVAWLYPLPKERWANTSAQEIARFVNMFEPGNNFSDDFGNIVRFFKSKIVANTFTNG